MIGFDVDSLALWLWAGRCRLVVAVMAEWLILVLVWAAAPDRGLLVCVACVASVL